MFTQSFIDDCILIFKELKKAPRNMKKKLSLSLKSQQGCPMSNSNNNQADTQSNLNSSPDATKTVNRATYKLAGNKLNNQTNATIAVAKDINEDNVESPRDKRYQPKNEYKTYNEKIDAHLNEIRAI